MAGLARLVQPHQPIPQETPYDLRLDRILQTIDANLDAPVGVAGPGSLDLMCALWRRGFQRVEAARGCTCGCADEMCALLLISGADVNAILATVEATQSLLRPDGRLAIVGRDLTRLWDSQRLCNHLATRGFRYRADTVGGPVLMAFKPGAEDFEPGAPL